MFIVLKKVTHSNIKVYFCFTIYMNQNTNLLNALINGDSKKIESIYTDNFQSVKRFILQNKGNIEDAEDIFQKALLQIAVRYTKEKNRNKNLF